MKSFLFRIVLISSLASCSNTPELETGEIKTLSLLKQTFQQRNQPKRFIDARLLLSRKQIDDAKIAVLFVELSSGQNGTLTPYPGQGVGQTWLGADGATITLERGVLKASRGMGNDLMGSLSNMPTWQKINKNMTTYSRKVSYITGDNKIRERVFFCNIQKSGEKESIVIWSVNFRVRVFRENCKYGSFEITNSYYLDNREVVRQSHQYHSETLGYILIQRLDR